MSSFSITIVVISALFLDATAYPLPSGSGSGITVEATSPATLQDSYICTTSEGVPYAAGSSIINTGIHQMAVCTGPNHWSRTVYPGDCLIRNKNWCWNNCAHNFGDTCSYYCACLNDNLGASDGVRLGGGGARFGYNDLEDANWPFGYGGETLGHSGGGSCPWWLPQALGQLTPGFDGFSCNSQGQFCKYPSSGMNFICQHGVWHRVTGPKPTPRPTPPPATQCPSWFQIWSGTWCPTNGVLCNYPDHLENFMCINQHWQLQNGPKPPTPKPTPPPTGCPSWGNIWNGDHCSTNGVLCNYPHHFQNFMCTNGQWQVQSGPKPPTPKPTPPPTGCPSWGNIWSGDHCSTNGVLCNYPHYFENFMCTNGHWVLQTLPGPPIPSPTPAPANPVNCPVKSYPPSNNGFCAVAKLTCTYPSGTFKCNNGRWKKLYF